MDEHYISSNDSPYVWDNPTKFNDKYANGISSEASDAGSASNISETSKQVDYIEKCIPNWKQTFPWVCWSSANSVLYCLHCREFLRRHAHNEIDKSNVFHIENSDSVFSVAKMLRKHHISTAHVASIYLYSHGSLSSFINLFNDRFNDMKTEEEVMRVVRSMFEYTKLDKDGLTKTIRALGKFVEEKLVSSVKLCQHFSVVADQCRGILILRWLDESFDVVEHVFWSYIYVYDRTPMQYLKELGLDASKISIYIANSLCQFCVRCKNVKVYPASLPPRPPSNECFLYLLWNSDFFSPLKSVVTTFIKLYRLYPYKFSHISDSSTFKSSHNFFTKPATVLKLMENFSTIKNVATDIYSKESNSDAFALSMVNLKNDEQHRSILKLLQEISDSTLQLITSPKISNSDIVKLNQAFNSLKLKSFNACFVTYSDLVPELLNSKRAESIREFLGLVEKFIDENQKSIYYNGRNFVQNFYQSYNLLDFKKKDGTLDEEKLINTFVPLKSLCCSLSAQYKIEVSDASLNSEAINFYKYLLQNFKVSSILDVIKLFHEQPYLRKKFHNLYNFTNYSATLPFLNCHVSRSLFVSFITEQRLESSVWVRMHTDFKPWILYLLQDFELLNSHDLVQWWMNVE